MSQALALIFRSKIPVFPITLLRQRLLYYGFLPDCSKIRGKGHTVEVSRQNSIDSYQ